MSGEFTVTIDDCPYEDVKRVIAGEEPSNALILYVRCMMAAMRATDHHEKAYSDAQLVVEIAECCHLYGKPNAEPVAVRIVEAADPAHLRGEKSTL